MSIETIARRYGSALADVVLKTGEAEVAKNELSQWTGMIESNASLHDAFSNPAIPHKQKEALLEDLIARTRPSKTTANFVRILLRNGRLSEISTIRDRFVDELEERSGVVSAEVISARELPSDQVAELKSHLEKLTGKNVNLSLRLDESLIGGVVTRIGSTVYDGSVRTKLENLRERLVAA
jgi:F-type H+-transporting ATPase subunit delta